MTPPGRQFWRKTPRRPATNKKKLKMYSLAPTSFCGYVNALVKCYNSKGSQAFYPHCTVTFPEFNKYATIYTQRYRAYMAKQPRPVQRVLEEGHLEKLVEDLQWDNVVEAQKYNAVIIGFRTGLRAETLRHLTFENLGDLSGNVVTPTIGNAKNLQASLESADMEFFQRPIMRSPDPRFCAVEAFQRQKKMVETLDAGENNWLFRTASKNGKSLLTSQASKNLFRAAAEYVSKKIGGRLVWRDVARRSVFTRLANTPGFSVPQTAKFLGVRPDIVNIYHQKKAEDNLRAAEVVAGITHTSASSSSSNLQTMESMKPEMQPRQIMEAKPESQKDEMPAKEEILILKEEERVKDAELEYECIDVDAWDDYEKYPLTQPSPPRMQKFNTDEASVNFDDDMLLTYMNMGIPETKKGSECAVCDRTEDEDRGPFVKWIQCDNCHAWFHLKCLKMNKIPTDDWVCAGCIAVASPKTSKRQRRTARNDDFAYDLTQLRL
jgi:hypothetical protein